MNYSSGFPILVLVLVEVSAHGFLLRKVVILCTHLLVSPVCEEVVCPVMTSLLSEI